MDKKISSAEGRKENTSHRRNVTIKDLARELELSITTISRALNGYSDVGEKTRTRVQKTADRLGYRPNRNAQRLVTRRTQSIAWIQSDNDKKFVDPHFIEVMAGVLRGARAGNYDIMLTSHTPEQQLAVYERYINDRSVDGFILDLPQPDDERIALLMEAGLPFVVHGRNDGSDAYSWVDVDNFDNYYRLTQLLVANGHQKIAFINGDEHFSFALERRLGVQQALADLDMPANIVTIYNALHPMGDAGFQLTEQALAEQPVTAILYSSALMAVEGHAALLRHGATPGKDIAVATMDDRLHYLDLSPYENLFTFVRSSLRDAGAALVGDIIRQCEHRPGPQKTIVPSEFIVASDLDASLLSPGPTMD